MHVQLARLTEEHVHLFESIERHHQERTESPASIFDYFDDLEVVDCVFGLPMLPLGGPKNISESSKSA